jgi:hypothetical protein
MADHASCCTHLVVVLLRLAADLGLLAAATSCCCASSASSFAAALLRLRLQQVAQQAKRKMAEHVELQLLYCQDCLLYNWMTPFVA